MASRRSSGKRPRIGRRRGLTVNSTKFAADSISPVLDELVAVPAEQWHEWLAMHVPEADQRRVIALLVGEDIGMDAR